jgi:hypothetical protein
MSRRRDNLSFRHHAELQALEPSKADQLLDWASANKASVSELRRKKAQLAIAAKRDDDAQDDNQPDQAPIATNGDAPHRDNLPTYTEPEQTLQPAPVHDVDKELRDCIRTKLGKLVKFLEDNYCESKSVILDELAIALEELR